MKIVLLWAFPFFFFWLDTVNFTDEKVGIPKPLLFFRGSEMETVEVRRFSVCEGID